MAESLHDGRQGKKIDLIALSERYFIRYLFKLFAESFTETALIAVSRCGDWQPR